MQTTLELNSLVRRMVKRLTIPNWPESIRILNDLYGDLGLWDYHEACGWLTRTGKTPGGMPREIDPPACYSWHIPVFGGPPSEHCLKPSFVFRIDRINKMSRTLNLQPQFTGFLQAWEQGGRPQGKDRRRLSTLLLNELTWNNWFSIVSSLATHCFLVGSPELGACHWLRNNAKRPHSGNDGYCWFGESMLAQPERICYAQSTLRDGFLSRTDKILGKDRVSEKIRPQLTAFLKTWREGLRP